jgi:DnaB-like helicase C terminal domain
LLDCLQLLVAYDAGAEGDKGAERLGQLSPRMQRIRPPMSKDVTAFWRPAGGCGPGCASSWRGCVRCRKQDDGHARIAHGLQVPVLTLVRLNRDHKGRADKRPTLTDLRESGNLENTADSVLGLYRDELEHPDSADKGLAELIVLNKRQFGDDMGTTRRLVWVGESYRDYAYPGERPV